MNRGVAGRVLMPKTACKKSRVSVPLRDTFQQSSACLNYTTEGISDPCLKSPLSLKSFIFVPQGLLLHGTTSKFKYLREFKPELEMF